MLRTTVGPILAEQVTHSAPSTNRIQSIDFLRGLVMIIMALDHVRDYFHRDAFYYSPTDLSHTSVALFFTRWITHFCAPVFVFLAGTSAYLYGLKRGKKALAFFLLSRGLWLVIVELFIIGLFRTFNPTFPYFNLQVIWAIGISMMVLSALIFLPRTLLLACCLLLIGAHNMFDAVHIPGNTPAAFLWSLLHDAKEFTFPHIIIYVRYPLLPWIGVMGAGYCLGKLYAQDFDAKKRKRVLLLLGLSAVVAFILLRAGNWYGDAAHWALQKNGVFSLLSFLNVTKYPPSLLYLLVTLGPALILLSFLEALGNGWKERVLVFGRVPLFYYLLHILLIHVLALGGALICGYSLHDMILRSGVNDAPQLKGYGFSLPVVYAVWLSLIVILYPVCKAFDQYKRNYASRYSWLSYL